MCQKKKSEESASDKNVRLDPTRESGGDISKENTDTSTDLAAKSEVCVGDSTLNGTDGVPCDLDGSGSSPYLYIAATARAGGLTSGLKDEVATSQPNIRYGGNRKRKAGQPEECHVPSKKSRIDQGRQAETEWLSKPYKKPQTVIRYPPADSITDFKKMLYSDKKCEKNGMTTNELAMVCCNRMISPDFVRWLVKKLNEGDTDTCIIFLNDDLYADPTTFHGNKMPSKFLFVVHVGRSPNGDTFLGSKTQEGSHGSLCHVDLTTKKVTYCDSLAWPMPSGILDIMDKFVFTKKYMNKEGDLSEYTILMAHDPTTNGRHQCNNRCAQAYPFQTCDTICGFVVMVMAAIACHNVDFFQRITTPGLESSFCGVPHLKDPTSFGKYLRLVVASWLADDAINTDYVLPAPYFYQRNNYAITDDDEDMDTSETVDKPVEVSENNRAQTLQTTDVTQEKLEGEIGKRRHDTPRGLQNNTGENRCYINSVLQCLASFNLVDSSSGSNLSWLLFHLWHSGITVENGCFNDRIAKLLADCGISNNNQPGNPAEFVHHILPINITSNKYETTESVCKGTESVRVICRNCGIHSKNILPFTILNLPSKKGKTVEQRLLDYFEQEVSDLMSTCCCGENKDLVEFHQPITLPAMLICNNMLPAINEGTKLENQATPQEYINIHTVLGKRYQLTACIVTTVYYGDGTHPGHCNCMVLRNKQWYKIDDMSVEPTEKCEVDSPGYAYLLFYKKSEKCEIETVVVDEIPDRSRFKDNKSAVVTTQPRQRRLTTRLPYKFSPRPSKGVKRKAKSQASLDDDQGGLDDENDHSNETFVPRKNIKVRLKRTKNVQTISDLMSNGAGLHENNGIG